MTKKAVKSVQFIYFQPLKALFERDVETLSEQMKQLKEELKIGIDPINNKIVNVKYINDVDVSKLIGGISAGDGIDVEDIGNGIFKVSVKAGSFATPEELNKVNDRFNNYTTTEELENKYATKEEVRDVDDRFNDYTTTDEIDETYATKDEVKEVVSRFNDYTSTTDLEATYATKDEVKEVDERFNDYTSTTDLEATYLKKDDLPTTIYNLLKIMVIRISPSRTLIYPLSITIPSAKTRTYPNHLITIHITYS